MAGDGTEEMQRFSKLLSWVLGQVNKELKEIETIVLSAKEANSLPTEHPVSKENEDLQDILTQVERIDDDLIEIGKKLLPKFERPQRKEQEEVPKGDKSGPQYERVFKTYIPRIDDVLNCIENSIGQINSITNVVLEAANSQTQESDTEAATKILVEKVKRIFNNMRSLEQSLVPMEEAAPVPEPQIELLYTPPPWSTPPMMPFYFEVREAEVVVEKIAINSKGHYLIGRLPLCDILVDDATCSRQHAVIQFRPGDPDAKTGNRQDEAYIYDLGSTSGTYVNGMPLQAKAYYPLYRGDILQFGQYAYAFVLRDGSEPGLEPPGGDPNKNEKKEDSTSNSNAGFENKGMVNSSVDPPKDDSKRGPVNLKDPKSPDFDKDAYKRMMIEAYERQKKENEEVLKRLKERQAQGLPPEVIVPEVPDRPRKGTNSTVDSGKKKKEKKDKDCIIS